MASTMTPTRSLSLSSSKDEKYDLEQTEHGLPGEASLKDIAYVKEAANVELATAIQEGEQFRAWSKGGMIILLCSFLGFLTSCCNGYDGSLMTAINGMTPYKHTITPGSPGLNKTTGIIFTCYTFGQMAGALFFGGPICDRLGRRYGMFIGCIIIMTGAAIISSSNDKSQFIAGRIAIAIIGAPTYCVEVAPPHWRGKITGLDGMEDRSQLQQLPLERRT
ncbi:hypothetical protein BT69DRAFT_1349344 [Atractiella rhizophila]|nr:hypothetical protein BT69DRAFT_1349344 [Atractiella rhizophila]